MIFSILTLSLLALCISFLVISNLFNNSSLCVLMFSLSKAIFSNNKLELSVTFLISLFANNVSNLIFIASFLWFFSISCSVFLPRFHATILHVLSMSFDIPNTVLPSLEIE